MYETVKNKFPHLSEEDIISIGEFTLQYSQAEIDSLFKRVSKIFL